MKLTNITQDQLKSMITGLQMLIDGRYYDLDEVIADTGWQGADAQQVIDAIRLLVEIEA